MLIIFWRLQNSALSSKSLKPRKTLTTRSSTEPAFSLWFFVFFTGLGIEIPRLGPLLFTDLNLPHPGWAFGAMQAGFPVGAFLFGWLSDKTMQTRIFLAIATVIHALAIWTVGQTDQEWATILAMGALGFSTGGILPLVNVAFLQSGADPLRYGSVRVFGTIGFTLSNAVLMFHSLSGQAATNSIALVIISSLLFLLPLPAGRKPRAHTSSGSALAPFRSRLFLLFAAIMFGFYFIFSASELLISQYMKESGLNFHGLDPVSAAWLCATSTEIIFFFLSPWLARKFSPLVLMATGFASALARYGLLAMIPLSPDTISLVIALQLWHGVQFGPSYLGEVLFLEKNAPPERLGTYNGLMMVFARAAGMGTGSLILGALARESAYLTVWISVAGVALTGLLLLPALHRMARQPGFEKA